MQNIKYTPMDRHEILKSFRRLNDASLIISVQAVSERRKPLKIEKNVYKPRLFEMEID